MTKSGDVGVVMLVMTGEGADEHGIRFNFFEYVPRFFAPPIRIAWTTGTMEAVIAADVADYLVKSRYARVMNDVEVRAYNRSVEKPETTSTVRASTENRGLEKAAAETPPQKTKGEF